MLLEKINKPSDIKTFTADELNTLAGEMRDALLFKLSKHGGHCGPNLGMVEAVIALHYVFDSPVRCVSPELLPQDAHRKKGRFPLR